MNDVRDDGLRSELVANRDGDAVNSDSDRSTRVSDNRRKRLCDLLWM
jgi:hypothetical protein